MSRVPHACEPHPSPLRVLDLGRLGYAAACREQSRFVAEALDLRDAGAPRPGVILLVEHDPPVITITRRPSASGNLRAPPELLQRLGVELLHTDRGGDITYHGPGQLVVYPILDLNFLRLRLHNYIRLLEEAAIQTCASFGVHAHRESGATGVWASTPLGSCEDHSCEKICAIGVRIRRWVSMHGLALNVTTNLDHFNLIVPCGLTGRSVTSLAARLGTACPSMEQVKAVITATLSDLIAHAARDQTPKSLTPASSPASHPP